MSQILPSCPPRTELQEAPRAAPRAMPGAEERLRTDRDQDPRESMRRVPGPLQMPLTFLTGKPHRGQRQLRFTPTAHLVTATASLVCGMSISGIALARSGWFLLILLPGWAVTLHAMRNLRMMIYHQCAHRNMWAARRPDLLVGRIVAGLLMVQDFDSYSSEHVRDHHAVHHMTLRDPTVQAFLVGLELRPGMPRRQMWAVVLGKLSSPTFHARFCLARIRSYFHAASPGERALTVIAYAAAALVVSILHAWEFIFVAWLLPLTLFFQVSNALRLCVKHTFPAPDQSKRRGKEYFASLTNAIFLGESTPAPQSSRGRAVLAWARWSGRMLFVHLPSRYLVLTGDTVCHDFHHRHPATRDWANYIFARQSDADSGHRGWPPYREVWGLVPAINVVFDSLSAADPAEYDPTRLSEVSQRELFTAFDD